VLGPNEIVGYCTDKEPQLGRLRCRIRRQRGEPYIKTTIMVLRTATYEEYVEYHEREGLDYNRNPPNRGSFFVLLMD
jgi:hypothetical protein